MNSLANTLSTLFSNHASKSRAPWPVHAGSYRAVPVQPRWQRSDAYKLYRQARIFDRDGRQPKENRGKLGTAAMRVLECLIFDFMNFESGRLDPSYEAIAAKANLARSTVAAALKRLQELHIIAWTRRCVGEDGPEGWRLRQISNSYQLQRAAKWLGWRQPPDEPPAPDSHDLGLVPPMPDTLQMAAAAAAHKTDIRTTIATLSLDPNDPLAVALAGLGQAILKSESRTETGSRSDLE